MQRRYNLAYFIIASIVGLGFMSLMISVDAQAQIAFVSNRDEHCHGHLTANALFFRLRRMSTSGNKTST